MILGIQLLKTLLEGFYFGVKMTVWRSYLLIDRTDDLLIQFSKRAMTNNVVLLAFRYERQEFIRKCSKDEGETHLECQLSSREYLQLWLMMLMNQVDRQF